MWAQCSEKVFLTDLILDLESRFEIYYIDKIYIFDIFDRYLIKLMNFPPY